uniref:Nuclear-export cofactor Arc1-like N-terminal domain-containing protein n=1 Tax=Rhizophora mucronata TaxID=61149 RepID=A0A2P2L403_RHIMU
MGADQIAAERKRLIERALKNYFHLPVLAGSISDEIENGDIDIKSLCLHVLKSAGKSSLNDEVMKWIGFVESFPVHSQDCSRVLTGLNEELALKSVLLGNGLTPSEADFIVFAAIHSFVIGLPDSEKGKLPHVMRWIDYIQGKENLGKLFEKILVKKAQFKPQSTKLVSNLQADSSAKGTSQNTKKAEKSEAELNLKKSDNGKTAMGNKESTPEKKGSPETEAVEKDKEVNVSLLNLQVGLIRKAWKHPSADRYNSSFFSSMGLLYSLKSITIALALMRQFNCRTIENFCSMVQTSNDFFFLCFNLLINYSVYWLRR